MALSEIEEVLASSLINIHTPKDWMTTIFLLLRGDEEEMFNLIKWIYDNEPTFDQAATNGCSLICREEKKGVTDLRLWFLIIPSDAKKV